MEYINKAFYYYFLAFKKSFDYSNPATRSELNYFILIFTIFYFLFFIVGMIFIIGSIASGPDNIEFAFKFFMGIIMVYSLAHILPSLAIICRRTKDIFGPNSSIYFGIYIVVWVTQVCCWLSSFIVTGRSIFTPMAAAPTPETFLLSICLGLVSQICGLLMLAYMIFLMCKKGNL